MPWVAVLRKTHNFLFEQTNRLNSLHFCTYRAYISWALIAAYVLLKPGPIHLTLYMIFKKRIQMAKLVALTCWTLLYNLFICSEFGAKIQFWALYLDIFTYNTTVKVIFKFIICRSKQLL